MAGPRDRRDRDDRDRGDRDDRKNGVRRGRRKHCQFCVARVEIIIDYKNVSLMRQYMDDRSRIRKARQTGTCRRHQNRISSAIKRSREIALVPYVTEGTMEGRGGRRGGWGGGGGGGGSRDDR